MGCHCTSRVLALHVLERTWGTWLPWAFTHKYDVVWEWRWRVFQRLTNINLSVGDFQTSAWSNCRQTQGCLEPWMCLTMPGKTRAKKITWGRLLGWGEKRLSVINSLSFKFGSKQRGKKEREKSIRSRNLGVKYCFC